MNNLPYSQEMRVSSTEATSVSLDKIHCLKLCKVPVPYLARVMSIASLLAEKNNNNSASGAEGFFLSQPRDSFLKATYFEVISNDLSKVSASPERQSVPSSCSSPL